MSDRFIIKLKLTALLSSLYFLQYGRKLLNVTVATLSLNEQLILYLQKMNVLTPI